MNRKEAIKSSEQQQFIPYTETHIITVEDLKQAYYRGYLDGIKKIRVNIEEMDTPNYDFEGFYKCQSEVLQIIDKYKAESEDI